MVTGKKRWNFVGRYIAPDNASTIEDVVAPISRQPQGAELMVDGNFNADLDDTEWTTYVEEIDTALVSADL